MLHKTDRSWLERTEFAPKYPSCTDKLTAIESSKFEVKVRDLSTDPLCAIMMQEILYYPSNSAVINKIMTNVQRAIEQYEHFSILLGKLNVKNKQGYEQYDSILNFLKKSRINFKKNRTLVRGFSSLKEVTEYTQGLSNAELVAFVPGVLGVVSFEDMDETSLDLKYSILYDTTDRWVTGRGKEDIGWVQDLIERAIVEVISNTTVELGIVLKETPTKCWERPAEMGFKMFLIILSFGTCFAFLGPPSTFLSEILLEKQLKMREYLYIMGVNSITLKLSWILFYCLFLIPLSVIFASLLVGFMADKYLSFTNGMFLYILIIGYNTSMLCFCYMLSNAFHDPKSSTQLLYCIHMIILILCTVQFGTNMPPTSVLLARIASFHPVVPLYLGFSYMIHWEMQWQGVTWYNMESSPVLTDPYGGLGEALRWMYFDIPVYFVLAWYFEQIFPGEFGQKLPFYFPFTPSYWKSEDIEVPVLEDPVADVETMDSKEQGVVIDKITKVYVKGNKVALNQLSLVFYKNEITAFVGHNGAGKSTLMNTLVGLINPSSGRATIHGLDVKRQMKRIRKILGFVPQYDILYPTFTVQEHLQFFGWLRGLSKNKVLKVTDPMLTEMGIMNMKTQITTVLSGGQKRKLSIITAYLGSPEAIIFDEPTSGVDPFSRRSIWETILRNKRDNTSILSTHFMDEADLLGDSIAIIDEGELKCFGTPMYLKGKYGKGYRLTIARNPEGSDKAGIIKFITGLIPSAKFTEEQGSDLDFTISKETAHSGSILTAFRSIEDKLDSPLGILTYGLHEPTIEDVFFSSIKKKNDKDKEDEAKDKYADQVQYTNDTSSLTFARIAWALFRKRALFAIYSPSVLALMTIIPMIFIFLLAITSTTYYVAEHADIGISDPSRVNLMFVQGKEPVEKHSDTLSKFLENAFKLGLPPVCPGDYCKEVNKPVPENMQNDPVERESANQQCSACSGHCKRDEDANSHPWGLLPSGDYLFRVPTSINLTNWMIVINQSKEVIIGGFRFVEPVEIDNILQQFKDHVKNDVNELSPIVNKTKSPYVVINHQRRLKLAMLNLWNTMLLRIVTGKTYNIKMSLKGEPLVHPSMADTSMSYFELFNNLFQGFWIISALAFGGFGVLIAVHYESSTGMKRLQIMYGANPILYWVVNLCFDVLQYLLTVCLIAAMIAMFNTSFKDDVGIIMAISIPNGIQAITFFYLISCAFARSKGIVNLAIFLTLLSSLISLFLGLFDMVQYRCNEEEMCDKEEKIMYGVRKLQECRFGFAAPWNTLLSSIPSYGLSNSIHTIGFVKGIRMKYNAQFTVEKQCEDSKCFCDLKSIYAFQFLGQQILKSIVWAILYFIAVLALEWFDVHYVFNTDLCRWKNTIKRERSTDADVLREAERVKSGEADSDNLVVHHLRKCYPDMLVPAVADLSFAVAKSEVFGLLGLNGAGKSTTFNMLTGFQIATSGSAKILGSNLFGTHWYRFKDSSYCPQVNTLFQSLTIEQHLQLFAALRGIPSSVFDDLMERIIKEVGLGIHKGKKAGQLSGGNQRKLNFAIALLDYRPVIFLDEPTSGMDPGARRQCWESVKRAVSQRNCSVVLTSHSMDECEALCHRIVVMVAGSFLCIGSIQYLKHKYGDKYLFKIKIGKEVSKDAESAKIKTYIKQTLPSSRLEDEHANVLSFDVPCSDTFKLSDLYKVMSDCRSKFNVEDVSVSQTTLEQVFINMAKHQDDIQHGTEMDIQTQENPNIRKKKGGKKGSSTTTTSDSGSAKATSQTAKVQSSDKKESKKGSKKSTGSTPKSSKRHSK